MSLFNLPRSQPSLPQNDSPLQRAKRQQELSEQQQLYRWTTSLQNVEGVPMASTVPKPDEPTLEWLLMVGDSALVLLENLLRNIKSKLDAAEHSQIADELKNIAIQVAAIRARFEQHKPSSGSHLLEDAVRDLRALFGPDLQQLLDLLKRMQALQEQFHQLLADRQASIEDYKSLFQSIPLPAIAENAQDDATFARLRVAGPNPMLLKNIPTLPANLPLTEAQYASVMTGDSLSAAAAEQRLFLLDYAELQPLVEKPGTEDGKAKAVYAPLALFARAKGASSITPVAIQCGQDASKFPIFLAASAAQTELYWGWQMAKSIVQVADENYHELFVHLGRTHLVLEAFTVATHRQLAPEHPVHILLIPHFEGSLFINNLAASSLIAPGGAIDKLFGAQITATQQAAGTDRLAFNFAASMLPADLAARNLAEPTILPDYPYRDDALLVWQAIAQWAQAYVQLYYVDDAAVQQDTELAAWCKAIIDQGQIKGFTTISQRSELVDTLTMIMFTASAQHAAVNFPQLSLMTYTPAFAGAGWSALPTQQNGHNQQDWLALLPALHTAMLQLNILYLLGSVYYRRLGEYKSNHFPYLNWFRDSKVDAPLAAFQAALAQVEQTITTRNQQRSVAYPYLLPSQIPPSINI